MNTFMKRITTLALSAIMLVGVLAGCQSSAADASGTSASAAQNPTTVTVEHALGTTEVPFAPTRVFVLDLAALDTIDALGLGEYVVGVQEFRNIPTYLSAYYDDDAIVVLPTAYTGHGDDDDDDDTTSDLAAAYNSVDADLIIGGSRQVDDYELLSELAPTIIMLGSDDDDETSASMDLLDLTSSEATTIASIWGQDTEVEAILADYESRIDALKEAISGKSGIIAAPNSRVGGITLSTTDSDSLLTELGFINLGDTAPEDLGGIQALTSKSRQSSETTDTEDAGTETTSTGGGGGTTSLDADVVAEALKAITDWIEEQNPAYLLIYDTLYTSLDEAAEADAEYPGVRDLTVYKDGNTFFLSSLATTKGGLTFAENQIAELEKVFLGK